MMRFRTRWTATCLAIVVCCCVLGFYRATDASQRTPNPPKQPFASAIEQRLETINELKAIRDLLKEQNRLIKEQNEIMRSTIPGATSPPKKS